MDFDFDSGRLAGWEDQTHLSCSRLRGYLDPGGNKGFSSAACGVGVGALEGLEEFPAFPDLTMPLPVLGGIRGACKPSSGVCHDPDINYGVFAESAIRAEPTTGSNWLRPSLLLSTCYPHQGIATLTVFHHGGCRSL